MDSNVIAKALENTLISPNVSDANFESANLIDVVHELAQAIEHLARAIEKQRP